MIKAWNLFPELVRIIKEDALLAGHGASAHDLIHDLTVAQYCLVLGEKPALTKLATVAAICHSTDRRYPKENGPQIIGRVNTYLTKGTNLKPAEKEIVVDLVARHSEQNCDSDSYVLKVLKDADRLANLGLQATLRCAQLHHGLPTFDPKYVVERDPRATYHDPRTVLHNVLSALEWDPREHHPQFCLRLPKAINMATPYFDWLKESIVLAERQVEETGIRDYP